MQQKGHHLEQRNNTRFPPGKSACPETAFFSEPAGAPGRANPEKNENATSFCGCVTEPHSRSLFAGPFSSSFLSFRTTIFTGFVKLQRKNGVQLSTRQHTYVYVHVSVCMCVYIYIYGDIDGERYTGILDL